MAFTRRDMLSRGAVMVASGLLAPSFIARTALALDGASASTALGAPAAVPAPLKNRILVMLQLSGGNDGIDTLIPFGDRAYSGLRDSLTPAGSVLRLSEHAGLHPGLAKLKVLYDQGKVAIVQGVGYPNPNRSHFRSMDIWHSGRPDILEKSGWLGRYLSACQCGQETGTPAVSVGDQLNGMFWTDTTLVPAVASVGAFSFMTDTGYKNDRTFQLQTLQNIYNQAGTWSAYESLIRAGTVNTLAASDQLQKVAAGYSSNVKYPSNNGLGNQLKLVAQVINGKLGTRLFSVGMGGFDTHAGEKNTHAKLFPEIGDALEAFMADLDAMGRADDVVIAAFSEFGRRVKPNGSGGTDHGTAGPVMIIGNRVQGGLYGTYPDLSDLDKNGDIKFNTDFRSIYAGLLKDHVGADPAPILGGTFAPISVLKQSA